MSFEGEGDNLQKIIFFVDSKSGTFYLFLNRNSINKWISGLRRIDKFQG